MSGPSKNVLQIGKMRRHQLLARLADGSKQKGAETAKILWNGQAWVADVLAVLHLNHEAWNGTYDAFSEQQLCVDAVSCVVHTWEKFLQVALPLPGPLVPHDRHLVHWDGAHLLAASGGACRQAAIPDLPRARFGRFLGMDTRRTAMDSFRAPASQRKGPRAMLCGCWSDGPQGYSPMR